MLRLLTLLCCSAAAAPAERYQLRQQAGDYPLVILLDEEAGVEASISPKAGGELCGLRFKVKEEWVEMIYRACDYTETAGWRGKAPLLWPATGPTIGGKQGVYRIAGKAYQMPVHGFARNMPWKVDIARADQREARALLSLSDTPETRKQYPFGWRLSVEYRLREGRLYLVYNVGTSIQNTAAMFFSIGNHITFRTPFLRGSDPLKMTVETAASTMIKRDAQSLPTGETAAPPFTGSIDLGRIAWNPALSLTGYKGEPTLSLTDPQGLRVRIRHTARTLPAQPFVQFNLWGDPKAGYFSPEPWMGIQNSLNGNAGRIELKPGEAWQWTIELTPSLFAKM